MGEGLLSIIAYEGVDAALLHDPRDGHVPPLPRGWAAPPPIYKWLDTCAGIHKARAAMAPAHPPSIIHG